MNSLLRNRIFALQMLETAFPWLGSDDEVDGADVVDSLNQLHANLSDLVSGEPE